MRKLVKLWLDAAPALRGKAQHGEYGQARRLLEVIGAFWLGAKATKIGGLVIRRLRVIGTIGLAAVIAVSAVDIVKIDHEYAAEANMRQQVVSYKPEVPPFNELADATAYVNSGIIEMQASYPDVVGWINIPHTSIDYPFVQSEDNNYYLRKNLDGDYALAGTILIDSRCPKDFSGFNTILFGHHMKSGAMFRDIVKFGDEAFWDVARQGHLFLADKTLELNVFAYLIVRDDDPVVYGTLTASPEERAAYLEYVKENAIHYRDPKLGDDGKVVALSTCTYEYEGARAVLLARIDKIGAAPSGGEMTDDEAAATHIPDLSGKLPHPIAGYALLETQPSQAKTMSVQAQLSFSDAQTYLNEVGGGFYKDLPFAFVPPVVHEMTSPFGARLHPIKGEEDFHKGVDLAATDGETIHAFATGTVVYADWSEEGGWRCKIKHEDGYATRYLHCSALLVAAGDEVSIGDPIALAGAEGMSTGPHLHFELQSGGENIDPTPYLM